MVQYRRTKMIPPSKEVRHRSIQRWMRDQQPQEYHRLNQSGGLSSRTRELDQMMVEEYERQEEELMAELDQRKTWGTQEGMQEFQMRRLQAWSDIAAQYLPLTTAPA